MPRRRAASNRLARQVAELAFAAPQVVAHRTAQMATAGPRPSARDQAEFLRMGAEKVDAYFQSWSAMWTAGWKAAWANQLDLAHAASSTATSAAAAATNAALGILSAGMAPVHRRAVSNAKRLGRRRK